MRRLSPASAEGVASSIQFADGSCKEIVVGPAGFEPTTSAV